MQFNLKNRCIAITGSGNGIGRAVSIMLVRQGAIVIGIDKDSNVLVMCGSGMRSQAAAELLIKNGYKCTNVSDGFTGNGADKVGWKNNSLPTK